MDTEIEYCGEDTQPRHDHYITDEERQHLISELHRILVWVGEPLPDIVNVDGKIIEVHETVWWCIHKKEFSEEEKNNFREIIHLLEKKEKDREETLHTANLTHEDANKLYHEIASITRAIIDIRECETGKVNLKEPNEDVRQRIDDAKRWMNFLKNIGKK